MCARVHDGHSFCGASDVTNCHCASPPSPFASSLDVDADPLARARSRSLPSLRPFPPSLLLQLDARVHFKLIEKHSER